MVVGFFVVLFFSFSFWAFFLNYSHVFLSLSNVLKLYFCFDSVSVYLIFLTVLMGFCVLFFKAWLSREEFFFVLLSQGFALLSYVCVHLFFFWFFYEMSIVILLYLLMKKSPYSERYTAFWYLLGYLSFSGVPMFLVVCRFMFWGKSVESCVDAGYGLGDSELIFLLAVLFMTKMPLFPFTSWLPVVHAEASSIVSVCLSGYVMKLGVLGLMRFCFLCFPEADAFYCYVGYLLLFAVLCFCFSCGELDKKRWLAFLSLAHMVVVPLCLVVSLVEDFEISFSYCLGHALSASVAFILFWVLSKAMGSRCWFVSKHGFSGCYVFLIFLGLTLCFCGSLPFCLQFFCEVYAVCLSSVFSALFFLLMIFYLFFSALVPLVCLGYYLTRHRDVRPFSFFYSGSFLVIGFLCVMKFFIFMFF